MTALHKAPLAVSATLPAILLFSGGCLPSEAAEASASKRIVLEFNWGAGLVATVRTTHTKSVSTWPQPLSEVPTERRLEATRRADGSYLIVAHDYLYPRRPDFTDQIAIRSEAAIDGAFDPPYRISGKGEYQGLVNYEKSKKEVMESIRVTLLPHKTAEERAQLLEKLDAFLSHDYLEKPVRRLWSAAVEQWMDLGELKLGKWYTREGHIDLVAGDNREASAVLKFVAVERVACDVPQRSPIVTFAAATKPGCVRLKMTARVDPKEFKEIIAEVAKLPLTSDPDVDAVIRGIGINLEFQSEVILEPATMRPFSGFSRRVLSFRVAIGDDSSAVEQVDNLTFAWTYPESPPLQPEMPPASAKGTD